MLLKDLLAPSRTRFINMTSISKNVYIDKLDDTVNKYNNKYHRTIKLSHLM